MVKFAGTLKLLPPRYSSATSPPTAERMHCLQLIKTVTHVAHLLLRMPSANGNQKSPSSL